MNSSKNNVSQAQSKEVDKTKMNQTQSKSKFQGEPKKIEKTIEQEIMEKEISTVEKQRLTAVFNLLCGENKAQQKFGMKQLVETLQRLDYPATKQEIEQMIWEVDEDLDESVSQYEFELMYKRCIFDKTGLEPRNLFNLVQFLMYDKSMKGCITVEDTLELLYVRYGRYDLDIEILAIFGPEEKTADGQEKEISYFEYLQKMRKRDFDRRQQLEQERKKVKKPEEENKK